MSGNANTGPTGAKKNNDDKRDRDVWIFDGSDVGEFPEWRRWAEAKVLSMPDEDEGDKKRAAMKLFNFLRGEARNVFAAYEVSELNIADGVELIFDKLKERYPERTQQDKKLTALDDIFKVTIGHSETSAEFTGRLRQAFSNAEKYMIAFDQDVRGYLTLKQANLTVEQRANVLTSTQNSMKEVDVSAALRTLYPQGVHRTTARAYGAHEDTDGAGAENQDSGESGAYLAGSSGGHPEPSQSRTGTAQSAGEAELFPRPELSEILYVYL